VSRVETLEEDDEGRIPDILDYFTKSGKDICYVYTSTYPMDLELHIAFFF
jgi:hypothetical protein